jgi:hypothetical protein
MQRLSPHVSSLVSQQTAANIVVPAPEPFGYFYAGLVSSPTPTIAPRSLYTTALGWVTAYALVRFLLSGTTRFSPSPRVLSSGFLVPLMRSIGGYIDGYAEQQIDDGLHREYGASEHDTASSQTHALSPLQRFGITVVITERFEDTFHKLFKWTNEWLPTYKPGRVVSPIRCAVQEGMASWLVMLTGALWSVHNLRRSSPSHQEGKPPHSEAIKHTH